MTEREINNEIFELCKKQLERAMPPISISVIAGDYLAQKPPEQDTFEKYFLAVLGCTADEAEDILWLCRVISMKKVRMPFNQLYAFANSALSAGDTPDEVRYHLYQECMVNRKDEFRTDTPEEQFFK